MAAGERGGSKGSHHGYLAGSIVGLGAWGFMTKEADGSGGPTIRAVGVETLLRELGIERVCLFKIDIEGAERQLFADPGASWLKQVAAFMVELHDRLERGCTAAFETATKDFPVAWHQVELTCSARAKPFSDEFRGRFRSSSPLAFDRG